MLGEATRGHDMEIDKVNASQAVEKIIGREWSPSDSRFPPPSSALLLRYLPIRGPAHLPEGLQAAPDHKVLQVTSPC